jgi:hypothetical protein
MGVYDGCKLLVTLEVAEPQFDNEGIYSTCPVYHRRNERPALPRLDLDELPSCPGS